jgi:hypothetical protein
LWPASVFVDGTPSAVSPTLSRLNFGACQARLCPRANGAFAVGLSDSLLSIGKLPTCFHC